MRKIILIVLMFIGNTYLFTGQNIEWQKSYGGSIDETAYAIQQTTDGGYIVAGISHSTDGDVHGNHGGSGDYWLLKLTATGDTVWTKCYGGSYVDMAKVIQQTTDGGYIVAGYSESTDGDVSGNYGGSDFWIIKLTATGDTIWTRCYGGSGDDYANTIQQTTDGGYIVAGYSMSFNGDVHGNHGGYRDAWLLKLTATGDTAWTRCYGGSGGDYANTIQQTTDGGYIMAGASYSTDGDVTGNHGSNDYWVLKLTATGDTVWTKCYGGSDSDNAYAIQQTTDGGYIVAGSSRSTDGDVIENHGAADFWIIKLTATGDTVWTKCYGGSGDDVPTAIQQSSDGGYIVAGFSLSSDGDVHGNHGVIDYWISKLTATGDTVWTKCYGGFGEDFANAIQQTTDGGYIVAGSSRSTDGDTTGNGYFDYWILKLDNSMGISTQNIEPVAVYPNPAHDKLTIIAGEAKQSAFIYNLQGQLIKSVKLGVKSSKYVIDIEDLPAGLYLLKLSGNKETKVSKFVKE